MKMWLQQKCSMAILACFFGLIGAFMVGTAQAQQCVDNGDETVTDIQKRLTWPKAAGEKMNWHQAMSFADSLALGGSTDWRLPNKDELFMLFLSTCKNLLSVQKDCYWSSSDSAGNPNNAWYVPFDSGILANGDKSTKLCLARAVRAQP